MQSKHLAMSASNTNFAFCCMEFLICQIASWHDLPGLKPWLFGSKSASHSGSRAALTIACKARSYIVGIPNGRFSSFPGLGIHTLRVGCDFPVNLSCLARLKRAAGDSDLIPSTPAVFFPMLSCVTRRTDKTLLDQDLINIFWSLRTRLTSPRREAA